MFFWDTDKIIGAGLVAALLVIVIGNIAITFMTGATPSTELPGNIVTGLAGYMGRSLLEKKKNDRLKNFEVESDNNENLHQSGTHPAKSN